VSHADRVLDTICALAIELRGEGATPVVRLTSDGDDAGWTAEVDAGRRYAARAPTLDAALRTLLLVVTEAAHAASVGARMPSRAERAARSAR
jgi:hypothetical protein